MSSPHISDQYDAEDPKVAVRRLQQQLKISEHQRAETQSLVDRLQHERQHLCDHVEHLLRKLADTTALYKETKKGADTLHTHCETLRRIVEAGGGAQHVPRGALERRVIVEDASTQTTALAASVCSATMDETPIKPPPTENVIQVGEKGVASPPSFTWGAVVPTSSTQASSELPSCDKCGNSSARFCRETGLPHGTPNIDNAHSSSIQIRSAPIDRCDSIDELRSALNGLGGQQMKAKTEAWRGHAAAVVSASTSLTSPSTSYRTMLVSFYQTYNPTKVGEVDTILDMFKGRETDLLLMLAMKYENGQST